MARDRTQLRTAISSLVVVLSLLASACSVEVARLSATPVATAALETEGLIDNETEPNTEPLTRRDFDTLLIDQFGWLDPEQIGRVRVGLLAQCGPDRESPTGGAPLVQLPNGLATYFEEGGVFDRISVLGPACSAVEQRGLPTDTPPTPGKHAVWNEAVGASFERVVWWYNQQLFEVRTEVACRKSEDLEDLDSDTLLSSTAAAEIALFIDAGSCRFLHARDEIEGLEAGPATTAGPRAVALSGRAVVDVNHQLVYRNPENDQYLDIFRLDVASGRLTGSILHVQEAWGNPDDRRNIVPGIVESPDGTNIAYLAIADGRHGFLVASEASGESPKMLAITELAHAAIAWAPDGQRLFYEQPGPWGEPGLNVVTLEGVDQELVASERSRLKLLGTTDDHVLFAESDNEVTELVRLDVNTYERVDSIEIGPSRSIVFEPATNTVTQIRRRDGNDPQRAVIYDVEGPTIESLRTVWFEAGQPPAKLSPDGTLLAYVSSVDLESAELYAIRLGEGEDENSVLLGVYDAGPGVIDSFAWGPDSSTIYFSHKRPGRTSHLFLGTLDGDVIDLGLEGIVEFAAATS